jgi:hypothetical protein
MIMKFLARLWPLLIVVSFFFLFPLLSTAQDLPPIPANSAFIGAVINSDNVGNFQFSAAYRKALTGPLATMTFYDVTGIKLHPFDLSNMQYSGRQALTLRLAQPNKWLSLWALGEAGITGTVDVALGSTFGGGGYADFNLGRNVSLLVMPKAVKNTVSGTNFELRMYFGTSW